MAAPVRLEKPQTASPPPPAPGKKDGAAFDKSVADAKAKTPAPTPTPSATRASSPTVTPAPQPQPLPGADDPNPVNRSIALTNHAQTAKSGLQDIEQRIAKETDPRSLMTLDRWREGKLEQVTKLETQARETLAPGFVEAGRQQNPLDKAATDQAVQDAANSAARQGSRQQGFSGIVKGAEEEANKQLDKVFVPIREGVDQAVEGSQQATALLDRKTDLQKQLDTETDPAKREALTKQIGETGQQVDTLRDTVSNNLLPALAEAGVPKAYDEAAMGRALDQRAEQLNQIGGSNQFFRDQVEVTQQNVTGELNSVFGPVRDDIARAQETGDWSGVRDAAIAQFKTRDGSPNREAEILNMGEVLRAGGPGGEGSPYVAAIGEAADAVLTAPIVQAVRDSLTDDTISDPTDTFARESLKVSPDLAARALLGKAGVPGQADIPGAANMLDEQFGALIDASSGPKPKYELLLSTALDDAANIADHVGQSADGEKAVERIATSVAAPIIEKLKLGPNRESGLVYQIGTELEKSMAAASSSPALAIEISRQLAAAGFTADANAMLRHIANGVDGQTKTGTETGKEFIRDFLSVAAEAAPNFTPEENVGGINALAKHQEGLLQKVDDTGEVLALTSYALRSTPIATPQGISAQALGALPPELRGLPAADLLRKSAEGFQAELNRDKSEAALVIQGSTKGTAELARQHEANRAELFQAIPDAEFNQLVQQLKEMPKSAELSKLVETLGEGKAASDALKANPELTLQLYLTAQMGAGVDQKDKVPNTPDIQFVAFMGMWAVYEVGSSPLQRGVGVLPGFPRPPTAQAIINAAVATKILIEDQKIPDYRKLDILKRMPWSSRADAAPVAKPGIYSNKFVAPFVYGTAALLAARGAGLNLEAASPLDKAWGVWLTAASTNLTANFVDSLYKPSISQLDGIPGYQIVPKMLTKSFQALSVIYTADLVRQGDFARAAAWVPGTVMSFPKPTAAIGRATGLGGPLAAAVAWVATAVGEYGISNYRRAQAVNRTEPLFGVYLQGAKPGVQKPESLANNDEDGVPYLDRQPALAKELGVDQKDLTNYLYSIPVAARDDFVEHAHQILPDKAFNYPVADPKGDYLARRDEYLQPTPLPYQPNTLPYEPAIQPLISPISRGEIQSIDDFLIWAAQDPRFQSMPGIQQSRAMADAAIAEAVKRRGG